MLNSPTPRGALAGSEDNGAINQRLAAMQSHVARIPELASTLSGACVWSLRQDKALIHLRESLQSWPTA